LVPELDLKQIQCLADNIYHEANGEPEEGKLAVALVTMNRTITKGFPDTVCGVVYERGQFTWASRKVRTNRETDRYKAIYSIAETTYINYRTMVDITKRSLYFHAVHVNPGWNLKRTIQLGRHVFYGKKDVQQRGENVGSGP
jgi:spore germination cell wall hydrolase CwlJ-like protein